MCVGTTNRFDRNEIRTTPVMKTALIVDDSRVARAVLRKTLAAYGVAVDEVPSAEAAIEYLRVDRPDIVFLDHMMPGMDGFDALGVLKANPSTATIPVMMYTSQEGQFYVSQARALGAVDVMPKSMEPADVERLLRSHHLIGEPRWTLVDTKRPPVDDHHELLEEFRAMLDDQASLLLADFRRELERAQSAFATNLRRTIEESGPGRRASLQNGVAAAAGVALLAVAVTVGVPRIRDGLSPVGADRLPGDDATESLTAANQVPAPGGPAATVSESGAFYDAGARSRNLTQHYAFDAIPLSDDRAREYAPLFWELKGEGVGRAVSLDIHEGRYCVNYASDGSAELAPPDQSAATCDYIGTLRSGAGATLKSQMFNNMLNAATRDGLLTIDVVYYGGAEPIIDYPALDYSVTAGYWNSVADINQRISMRVRDEDPADSGERIAQLTE